MPSLSAVCLYTSARYNLTQSQRLPTHYFTVSKYINMLYIYIYYSFFESLFSEEMINPNKKQTLVKEVTLYL